MPYYGRITKDTYAKALNLRGDDDCCWEEKVPLVDPALMFGPKFPEDLDGDEIIDIWEEALETAESELGHKHFTLDSVTIFLEDAPGSMYGQFVWEKRVSIHKRK